MEYCHCETVPMLLLYSIEPSEDNLTLLTQSFVVCMNTNYYVGAYCGWL